MGEMAVKHVELLRQPPHAHHCPPQIAQGPLLLKDRVDPWSACQSLFEVVAAADGKLGVAPRLTERFHQLERRRSGTGEAVGGHEV